MASKTCNYCHVGIDFIQLDNGKWRPVTPGTQNLHRCKLEQTCAICHQKFEGPPWMTHCQKCYKANRPNTRGFQKPRQDRPKPEPPDPVDREEVKPRDDGFFDDIPF